MQRTERYFFDTMLRRIKNNESTLTSLDFSTSVGIDFLCQFLTGNVTLKTLILAGNDLNEVNNNHPLSTTFEKVLKRNSSTELPVFA